jgi:DNA-binding CsgD family transcriptional regulator
MGLDVPLFQTAPRPPYQEMAAEARQLHELGLGYAAIARRLRVTGKTVAKAVSWIQGK